MVGVVLTTPSAHAATGKPPVPAAGSSYLGAFTPGGPYDLRALDAFATDAQRRPDVVMWFQGWGAGQAAFDPVAAATVKARGAVPMITWEPWDWQAGLTQPAYTLDSIAGGGHDLYLRTYATAVASYGGPVLLRFAHEMNAAHYPWSEQVNGNGPGDYVRAWRHVHDVFTAAGAGNVGWVWSPSITHAATAPLSGLYPGDAYVDWVAADGYNGGTALPWGGWLSFRQLFGPTLDELAALAPTKPQMIGETASAEQGGSKATWITEMFQYLATRPAVRAAVWFDESKEADWRITSSETARAAFARAVSTATVTPGKTRPQRKRWLAAALRKG
jgi:beta-mannanase